MFLIHLIYNQNVKINYFITTNTLIQSRNDNKMEYIIRIDN